MDAVTTTRLRIASYVLAAVALVAVLVLHLLPALLAGLLVYAVIQALAQPLQRHLSGARAHQLIVALLSVVVAGILGFAVVGIVAFTRSERGNPGLVFDNLMPLVDQARAQLPHMLVDYLPESIGELRNAAVEWLKMHSSQVGGVGRTTLRVIAHLLIGMALGALIALVNARRSGTAGPLARMLAARCDHLLGAFHDIVFAQVRISALNTVLTALFVLVLLPILGVELPLAKALVVVTFVTGLLPVVGNLISNSLIFVVGLSVSLTVGVGALVFLILIHKLEYFLNARIVGGQIHARAWELLVAMLALEAAFGLAGLIAAPIYYAYLKSELKAAKLI